MGTDNIFHKRKAKQASDLKRRRARREPYSKVLIVCEGEKTEPNYFREIKDYYGLNSANVEVIGECGSDPVSVFSHAKQRYREERDSGDPFDKVYCVFDKDSHQNYYQAVSDIERFSPKDTFYAITSVPCFEYWLLLHFIYTAKPYNYLHGSSAGALVVKDLKKYMYNYEKSQKGVFLDLVGQLEYAKNNAERSLKEAASSGTDNPSTKVHNLVVYLQNIKN